MTPINGDTPIAPRNSNSIFERIELHSEIKTQSRRPRHRLTQAEISYCTDSYIAARNEGLGWTPAVRARIGEPLGITQNKVYKTVSDRMA